MNLFKKLIYRYRRLRLAREREALFMRNDFNTAVWYRKYKAYREKYVKLMEEGKNGTQY